MINFIQNKTNKKMSSHCRRVVDEIEFKSLVDSMGTLKSPPDYYIQVDTTWIDKEREREENLRKMIELVEESKKQTKRKIKRRKQKR